MLEWNRRSAAPVVYPSLGDLWGGAEYGANLRDVHSSSGKIGLNMRPVNSNNYVG